MRLHQFTPFLLIQDVKMTRIRTSTKAAKTRTPAEARAHLESQGISVASFARTHGLPYGTLYQVLTGEKKGRRGEAHRAAVLLGIKAGEIIEAGAERHE